MICLDRFSGDLDDGAAQYFVALDDLFERALEQSNFERPADAIPGRHVVRREIRIELVQKPQALLGKRKRRLIRTTRGHDRRQSNPASIPAQRFNLLGQTCDRARFEKLAQRQFRVKTGAQAHDDASGQE